MDRLVDPLDDRQVKNVRPPPHKPLDPTIMYPDPSNNHFCQSKSALIGNPTVPDLSVIR